MYFSFAEVQTAFTGNVSVAIYANISSFRGHISSQIAPPNYIAYAYLYHTCHTIVKNCYVQRIYFVQ